MKSWKIGAVSGLLAGIVLGVVYEICNQIAASLGLFEPYWRPIVVNNIVVNILLFGFWGFILGIIFSKINNIIPRKDLSKGPVYGLFLYFIIVFRIETFSIPYGLFLDAVGGNFAGFFSWLTYGSVLGILYKYLSDRFYHPKKEVKIKTYDMRSGLFPGAIAGFCGGMPAAISQVVGHVTGYWGVPATSGQLISTIEYWWNQAGTHILINMIWGTVFGAIFAIVYDLVPGKKIRKGILFGLIMFFITTFLVGTWLVIWPIFHNEWNIATYYAGAAFLTGGANAVVFGLVLGLLYRKPSK